MSCHVFVYRVIRQYTRAWKGPGTSKFERRRGFLWRALRLAREAEVAALLPTPQPEAEDGVRASAARARRVRSAGCGGQLRLEAPDPGIGLLRLGCQRLGISPGAAVSRRFAVVRRLDRCRAAAHAVGGGRLNPSGTIELGARNIVATSAGRSRWAHSRFPGAVQCVGKDGL